MIQRGQVKSINLKARILLPFSLVTALLLSVFVVGVYLDEQEHMSEDHAYTIQSADRYYHSTLNERGNRLSAALALISAEPGLRSALATHDREALLASATPLFERLKIDLNITHFYFHDSHRVNILRVHQPDRFGDTINRYTALAAEKNMTISDGMELGPLGTFTLRAVLPVMEGERLLGYIELGEEVDQIIQGMENLFDVDLVVAIDKQYLRMEDWAAGNKMLERQIEWWRFPEIVVVSQTLKSLPEGLVSIFSRPADSFPIDGIEVIEENHRYQGRFFSLMDVANRRVGSLVLLHDMSTRIQRTREMLVTISATTLVLAVLLFVLIYTILGRTERKLIGLLTGLKESQSQLSNAQHMAHLGHWSLNLKARVMSCSDETARILGVDTVDLLSDYESLHACVHPQDQDMFQHFIDKLTCGGDVHELIHRIVWQDGTERIVRHRSELDCDDDRINATIQDITEMQRAEMRSVRLGRILEHSWDEIYTFEYDSLRFVDASNGACRNSGYSIEELQNLTPLDLKPEFTQNQFEALIGPLRRGEEEQISFETVHQRKNGSHYPVEVRLQLSSSEKPPVFIAIIQDISERKRYIEDLEHKAMYDSLTDIPNRSLLQDRIQHALKIAQREASQLAVLVIDVIRLREINDLMGHYNGDLVLVEIAKRLQRGLRSSDTIARLGGDEFVIVLPGVDFSFIRHTANKVQELFVEPIIIDDIHLELEAAIGVAQYPDHGDTPAALLQHADIAMRISKDESSNFTIYNPEDDPFSVRQLKLHGELRQAISDKTLAVYYQPKIDIKMGKVVSVEALSRWPHPDQGMISPVDFIPMVEQSGMIRPFTLWVLEQAIKQQREWAESGIDLTVAVNLSTRNLLDPRLADSIAELLDIHQVSHNRLTLEITESSIMARPETALKMLTRLHKMGLKLSVDDFGTGYSSLAYLKQLPVSELKIDYSFVAGINDNEDDAVIVHSTIELAHNLGLTVVAEGIEDKNVLELLETMSCDIGQGYYFSHPLPSEEFSSWLADSSWGIQGTTGID